MPWGFEKAMPHAARRLEVVVYHGGADKMRLITCCVFWKPEKTSARSVT